MRGDNVVPFYSDDRGSRIEEFRPIYVSQLEGKTPKPREWLVDGILMRGTVTLFAGPPKVGKSLLGQQLLTAVASGLEWLGHAVMQVRTFGLFTEDPIDELHRRQDAINAHYQRNAADFELDMSFDAREGKDAMLCTFDRTDTIQFTPLWFQLWNYVQEEGVGVVMLDPVSVIYGGSENFRNQVTIFMRELVKKAVAINGAILLSVHPSKAQASGYSGSTAWLGAARFGMTLQRPPEYDPDTDVPRDARVLRGLGANYTAGFKPQRLEYRDGVFDLSAPPEAPQKRILTQNDRVELRYRLLAGVKRVVMNGGRVPADEMHRESMPARARRSPDAQINHVPLNDLYAAQGELIDSGQLVRVDVARRCLLRPADGPLYPNEMPWLSS